MKRAVQSFSSGAARHKGLCINSASDMRPAVEAISRTKQICASAA
jgi:hypothetical protein